MKFGIRVSNLRLGDDLHVLVEYLYVVADLCDLSRELPLYLLHLKLMFLLLCGQACSELVLLALHFKLVELVFEFDFDVSWESGQLKHRESVVEKVVKCGI